MEDEGEIGDEDRTRKRRSRRRRRRGDNVVDRMKKMTMRRR